MAARVFGGDELSHHGFANIISLDVIVVVLCVETRTPNETLADMYVCTYVWCIGPTFLASVLLHYFDVGTAPSP